MMYPDKQVERSPWDWIETAKRCPACQKEVLIRTNRQTQRNFLGCSGYPICRWTYSPYGYGGLAHGMPLEGYLKTLADYGQPIEWPKDEPNGEPSNEATVTPEVETWVTAFLARNDAFIDSFFRALGALNGNATREGRGGFERHIVEAEILRQLSKQAEKK